MSEGMSAERLAEIRALIIQPTSDDGTPFAFLSRRLAAAVELLAEMERLHTWAGLMSLLDQHYPPDVFDGSSGDPGPRIVALTRAIAQLRTRLDEIGETREEWGVSWPDTSIIDFANSEAEAREWIAGYMQMVTPTQPNAAVPIVKQRTVISSKSQWREVPDA